MSEFFQGWRRKIGAVTLTMACVVMGLWVRSSFLGDSLAFSVGGDRYLWLASFRQSLMLIVVRTSDTDFAGLVPQWDTQPVIVADQPPWDDPNIEWVWRLGHYGYGVSSRPDQDFHVGMLVFPHWSVVLPLTALAAFLLLTKSQKSNPNKNAESDSAEGA